MSHDANLALVRKHLRGRSQVRAGNDLYDDSLTLCGDDPRSHVAAAARGVLALHQAGAVDAARTAAALAALVDAYRLVRPLGGRLPESSGTPAGRGA